MEIEPDRAPVRANPSSMWMMREAGPESTTRTDPPQPVRSIPRTRANSRDLWTSEMMSADLSTDSQVAFRPIRLSSHWGVEEAWLGLVGDQLVSILVRAGDRASKNEGSWYLEIGFGSC